VHDHDPSNSEFSLRLKDFGSNRSFLVELGCDSISSDSVHLRAQVWGITSPRDASHLPQIFTQELKSFGRNLEHAGWY
jgi:hypothetical protein